MGAGWEGGSGVWRREEDLRGDMRDQEDEIG